MMSDLSSMTDLKVAVPKGIPRTMVLEFLERCRAGLPALRAALNAADFDGLRVSGHRLKGTGSAYGFPPLTALGALIETAARGKDGSELRKQVAALEGYLGKVEVVMDEGLS
jgi:HPt (histidine-containing phosphotransfer) domain-containing protein